MNNGTYAPAHDIVIDLRSFTETKKLFLQNLVLLTWLAAPKLYQKYLHKSLKYTKMRKTDVLALSF